MRMPADLEKSESDRKHPVKAAEAVSQRHGWTRSATPAGTIFLQ